MEKKLRIVHIAYFVNDKVTDPQAWIKQLGFYTIILEKMTLYGEVFNFDFIGFSGTINHNGVVHVFQKSTRIQLLFPVLTHRKIKKLKPDVVIVHGLIFPWQVMLLRWHLGKNVKIILQHHAERAFKDFRKYIQRWVDRYVNAYLFASVASAREWIKDGQISSARKVKEIMGTSSAFYFMEREPARARTKVLGDRVFLWVGRLDENKDPLVVAKAFLQFVKVNPGVNLYMIYQTYELEADLKTLIANSENGNSIHLVGKLEYDQLLWWYNSADFIISSSHYEGSGIAVCEALSCGCVPILTNIPSFRWMTSEGKVGILYTAGDVDDLHASLQKSNSFNLVDEQKRVLNEYSKKLSPEAAARDIYDVIVSVA